MRACTFFERPNAESVSMNIVFKRLTDVAATDIIDLMNHPLVTRQMPLATHICFDEATCDAFIAAKERLWSLHGYGPWAFVIDGRFAGWGGLQTESGDADLALVLHPDYWGVGKILYANIIERAFSDMNLDAVTILLPTTRVRIRAVLRLGFLPDGYLDISGERFVRYRLTKSDHQRRVTQFHGTKN